MTRIEIISETDFFFVFNCPNLYKVGKEGSRLGVILKFTRRESAFKSIDYQ
jgi:hypothetical protein